MANTTRPKKFKIEPFKHPLKLDPDYAGNTWAVLEAAIKDIHGHNTSGLSYEELYRNAYNMVINKHGGRLYAGLVDVETAHLRAVAARLAGLEGDTFLRGLKAEWDSHNKAVSNIRDILLYMDRIYVKQAGARPVVELGLDLWRDHVARAPGVAGRLRGLLLDAVARERRGEAIDRPLVAAQAGMLADLGLPVYRELLEAPLLAATAEFYAGEAAGMAAAADVPAYLEHAERRLAEEAARVAAYLHPSSEPALVRAAEAELLGRQLERLVDAEGSGLVPLLLRDAYEPLGRMRALFARVPGGLDLLRARLGDHVRGVGRALVLDAEAAKDPVGLVRRLLAEKDKYDAAVARPFGGDKGFQAALNAAFEAFLNLAPRAPEYVSLYIDDRLRRGGRGGGAAAAAGAAADGDADPGAAGAEDDVEAALDKAIALFRYLQEKDVFEKYYKQHLARRLLHGRAAADDAERSLLAKLKAECGYQFTSKLESMFNDVRASREAAPRFKAWLAERGGPALPAEVSVQVLTTGSWPTPPGGPAPPCRLPAEVGPACAAFGEFYAAAHSGRRLAWQTSMGTADIKATFGDGRRHELSVSTHQMCVLLLFNDAERLTWAEIAEATAIPEPDLRRTLQSLACVKGRAVLRKDPPGRECGPGDAFAVNDAFSSKLYKVKIGTVAAARESEAEKAETRGRVEEDRKPQVEAAIVRTMKARRQLSHNDVVAEVTRQLAPRFVPAPALIKKRLESLIEREFLERDVNDRSLYRYLA